MFTLSNHISVKTSGLQGSMNVHRGALLWVPQWRHISSFVFYIVLAKSLMRIFFYIIWKLRTVVFKNIKGCLWKTIFSFKVKVTRSLTLVSYERASLVGMHAKYGVSISYGSNVIAKVKVDNRQTYKLTDRTKTICPPPPDHSIQGIKNLLKWCSLCKKESFEISKVHIAYS